MLKRLEQEGWAKVLTPVWTSAKVNEAELERLRDTVGQMESMGIHPDPSAAYFPLLTAKLAPKDIAALKAGFARPGFAEQIDALDGETKAFATAFASKAAAAPSDAWKLLFSSPPEQVLWLAHTTKSGPLQAKFKAFFSEWSQSRNKIPYQLMQEMRIVPTLAGYDALLDTLFFAVMDGKLETTEMAKAFLEPYSPPAPPPPVNLRRRAVKKEARPAKPRSKKAAAVVEPEEVEEAPAVVAPPVKAVPVAAKKAIAVKAIAVKAVASAPAKAVAKKAAAPVKAVAKKAVKAVAKKAVVKAVVKKAVAKKAVAKKAVAKKAVAKKAVAKKAVAKKAVKKAAPAKKVVAKKAVKVVAKKAATPVKAVAKKVVAKKVSKPVKAVAKKKR